MVINIKSTEEAYKEQQDDITITAHENGIVEVHDEANIWIWFVVDHIIGANPNLIPMSIAMETDIDDGSKRVIILFVEKSVFGHQSTNLD